MKIQNQIPLALSLDNSLGGDLLKKHHKQMLDRLAKLLKREITRYRERGGQVLVREEEHEVSDFDHPIGLPFFSTAAVRYYVCKILVPTLVNCQVPVLGSAAACLSLFLGTAKRPVPKVL